jgi:hypothetical protein
MLPFSLTELLSETWHLSLRRRQFWMWGSILALPVLAQAVFLADVPTDPSLLRAYSISHTHGIITFALIAFVSTLIGKSGLIIALHKTTSLKESRLFSWIALRKAAIRGLQIECFSLLFVLILGLVLMTPFLVALSSLGAIPPILHWLVLFVVIPITLVMLIVREFTFFYYLLTPGLRFRSALDAGIALFQKHSLTSLQFILLMFSFTLLFTFSLNLAMLSIVALSHLFLPPFSESILVTIGSFLALSVFEVIRQGLWFLYFERLAQPKDPIRDADTASIEKEMEMPPA